MVSHKPFLTATGFLLRLCIITVEISYLSRIFGLSDFRHKFLDNIEVALKIHACGAVMEIPASGTFDKTSQGFRCRNTKSFRNFAYNQAYASRPQHYAASSVNSLVSWFLYYNTILEKTGICQSEFGLKYRFDCSVSNISIFQWLQNGE